MAISKENLNIVLGLKVGWMRQQQGLSLKELSDKSGLSVSYINEIEKGKKYPKADKVMSLAEAFGITYDELVSLQLDRQLTPLSDFLSTSFLQEIPLEIFGLNQSDLMEAMTNAPAQFAALIDTIIKIARSYDVSVEQLLFGALRSFQEMHGNYFEDIEEEVIRFKKQRGMDGKKLTAQQLAYVLESEFGYQVDRQKLNKYEDLKTFRAVFLPGKPPRLMVNPVLMESQQTFVMCRELGYEVLGLKERVTSSSHLKEATFGQLLSNMKASYFAGAMLLERDPLLQDLRAWFEMDTWDMKQMDYLLLKYDVTPEMLFHRITQLMKPFFQLEQLYFLRFNHHLERNEFRLTKELHFSKLHSAHGIGLNEHYCRRWITLDMLQRLNKMKNSSQGAEALAGVQRSLFHQSVNEYFCISVARPLALQPNIHSCVTIGFLMTQKFKRTVRFWDDDAVPQRVVNRTCERCGIMDCEERAAEPVLFRKEEKLKKVQETLELLRKNESG